MLELRPYQRASLDSLYEYWRNDGGNGLIVLPTGAGKALVIAKLIEELLADYPTLRIANVTHSASLVAQNFREFIGIAGDYAPAGIYSAGLGRRDRHAQVLFGGIQSIANKTEELGPIDLVIVDEAHAISRNSDTLYGKFFEGVRSINPDSRVVGTTATDYRMDSGRLTEGDGRLFDDVVYEIGIGELMAQGYLTRLSTKRTEVSIDLSKVGTRGGEFIPGQLEEAADRVVVECVGETLAWARAEDRKACLFFCSGQDHSEHVRDEVRRQGMTCESLTSRTTLGEQARILSDFKAGRVWALSSANMLTTGSNFPFVDTLAILRATKSPGLYVQICGRGTRNSPGKQDCLVLDFGGNRQRHGPIDKIEPRTPGTGGGEAPVKICPHDLGGCEEILPISVMKCTCCGYEFPPNEEEKIAIRADDTPLLSTEQKWSPVKWRKFRLHPPKVFGNPPSVKCTFMVGMTSINTWHCPQHLEHPNPGSRAFPKAKADRFWRDHGGLMPAPRSVDEWLNREIELRSTAEVQLSYEKNPKYPEVKAYRVAVEPAADNDNRPWEEELDDAIPF